MVGNYYAKSDIINASKGEMTTSNPEVTKQILTGVNDPIGLILAVEKFNDDNKLPLNKRVKYSVGVGGYNYITVAKAYEMGDNMVIIGWDKGGYPTLEFNDRNQVSQAMSALSTHIVRKTAIFDVNIPSYDDTKLGNIFDFKTADEIREKDLITILTDLETDLANLLTSGQYRNLIEKFNYEFKKHHLNDYNYKYKPYAYNVYIRVFSRYILAIKDIVIAYVEKNSNVPLSESITKFNNFDFVDSFDDLDPIVAERLRDRATDPDFEYYFNCTKDEMKQTTFLNSEVENTFKAIIDYDKIDFDHLGNIVWKK